MAANKVRGQTNQRAKKFADTKYIPCFIQDLIGYELALVNNVYVIFKPGQPHRFPASFAFEIG